MKYHSSSIADLHRKLLGDSHDCSLDCCSACLLPAAEKYVNGAHSKPGSTGVQANYR